MDFTRIATLGRKYGLSRRSISLSKNANPNSRILPSERPSLGKSALNQYSKLWRTTNPRTIYQQPLVGAQNPVFISSSSMSPPSPSSHLCISLSKSLRGISSCSISTSASSGNLAAKQAMQMNNLISGSKSRYHDLLKRYTTSSDPLSARSSESEASKPHTEVVKVKTEPPPHRPCGSSMVDYRKFVWVRWWCYRRYLDICWPQARLTWRCLQRPLWVLPSPWRVLIVLISILRWSMMH